MQRGWSEAAKMEDGGWRMEDGQDVRQAIHPRLAPSALPLFQIVSRGAGPYAPGG